MSAAPHHPEIPIVLAGWSPDGKTLALWESATTIRYLHNPGYWRRRNAPDDRKGLDERPDYRPTENISTSIRAHRALQYGEIAMAAGRTGPVG